MAKSLRSKWKRKMRAIKRVRYGVKEDERLVNMIKAAKANEDSEEKITMPGVQFVSLASSTTKDTEPKDGDGVESMELDAPKRNMRTMRDENGNYPVWMNQRKVKALKKGLKRKPNAKGKKKAKK